MIFLAPQPLVDVLEQHLQELGWLLGLRRSALGSQDFRPRDVRLLDARLAAHADALVLAGRDAEPLLLDTLESADDPDLVAAAALVLVQTEDPKVDVRPVLDHAAVAEGDVLRAVAGALTLVRPSHARDTLAATAQGGQPRSAATAMRVLAASAVSPAPARIAALIAEDDPLVRESAWAIVATLTWGGRPSPALPPQETWQAQLRADCEAAESPLRDAALIAAVMTRQKFLLPFALEKAVKGTRADLSVAALAAVLAQPADVSSLLPVIDRQELGLGRFEIAANAGAPAFVEPLIAAMASPDATVALAASDAFRRITGFDVAAEGVVRVPPDWRDEPTDVDEDLLEEVPRLDANDARVRWLAVRDRLSSAPRLCLGVPLAPAGVAAVQRDTLDMKAVWHDLLRASHQGDRPVVHDDFWHALQPLA